MSERVHVRPATILIWALFAALARCTPPSAGPNRMVDPHPERKALERTAMRAAEQAHPGVPVLVAFVAEHEGQASALALPFGAPLQYLLLRRRQEAWEVVAAVGSPPHELAPREGSPVALLGHEATGMVLEGWMAQLQDPRGRGVHDWVWLEGREGDYGLACFRPAAPDLQDPVWAFLHRDGTRWHPIAVGTAFEPELLRGLGIPEALQLPRMNTPGSCAEPNAAG